MSDENISDLVKEAEEGDVDAYGKAIDYFLSDETPETHKTINVTRYNNKTQNDDHVLSVMIKSIDDTEYRESILRASKAMGKKKKKTESDAISAQMNHWLILCEVAIIKPDLRNKALLQKYGTVTRALQDKLKPGEIQGIAEQILDISGYGDNLNDDPIDSLSKNKAEEVEAAKN